MVLIALSVLVLILAVSDMGLYSGNRARQDEIRVRGRYVQQSLQLQPVYDALVRNLAQLSAQKGDAQLRKLLASQGITFNVNARPPRRKPASRRAKAHKK
jgi:hypothetical protein